MINIQKTDTVDNKGSRPKLYYL